MKVSSIGSCAQWNRGEQKIPISVTNKVRKKSRTQNADIKQRRRTPWTTQGHKTPTQARREGRIRTITMDSQRKVKPGEVNDKMTDVTQTQQCTKQ